VLSSSSHTARARAQAPSCDVLCNDQPMKRTVILNPARERERGRGPGVLFA
jgi:hypothetical protein